MLILGGYNYGQKSWEKLKLFARFLTRKTNSRVRRKLYLPFPSFLPSTVLVSTRHFFWSFNFVLGGGGGNLHIFQRIAKCFKTSGEKQDKIIHSVTSVSQGLLSIIVCTELFLQVEYRVLRSKFSKAMYTNRNS